MTALTRLLVRRGLSICALFGAWDRQPRVACSRDTLSVAQANSNLEYCTLFSARLAVHFLQLQTPTTTSLRTLPSRQTLPS